MKVEAPWTLEQVECLNRWQTSRQFHPFTCVCNSDNVLIATTDGWVCPHCGYTQNWAHDFMTTYKGGGE